MYEIEKGIPIPKSHAKGLFPFQDMEIGDSFLVEVDPDILLGKQKLWKALRNARDNAKKDYEIETTYRKVGPGRFRVWRTK